MPLEHCEDLSRQQEAVEYFTALAAAAPVAHRDAAATALAYAEQHRDIIARFGRFPHRNALLGRRSTARELAWLEAGAPSFGQQAPR